MRILKLLISATITTLLLIILNNGLPIDAPIPPLGKFLDPFHGFWQNCKIDRKNGAINLPGLIGKAEVVYDSSSIPHVFAENEADLYMIQGYVTAKDRLWQMEFQTLAAAGRISEIMGPGKDNIYLNFDRDQRRMGMVTGAEKFLDNIKSDSVMIRLTNSYTAGINQLINQLNYEDYPIEYKLLDYSPEEWTNLKCALFQKNMAKTLNTGEKDIEMTNALQLLGKKMLDILYPDRERVGDPIVDNAGHWKNPIKLDSIPLAVPQGYISSHHTEKTDKDIGSNNWVLSGTRTATGAPILCNDPHLSLNLPSIWYIIHLSCPGYNAMGASLPGSPSVIVGFNDSIAWGETNAQRDAIDWYKIKFKDETMNEYLSDGAWRKTNKVVEIFKVKGQKDFVDTIVFTHHGPIRYDRTFKADLKEDFYAFRWLSHDPSNEMRTFYELNKAKNIRDYHKALNHFSNPAQNFVFASVAGDIAIRVQGKFPVRRNGEGKFILDGTQTSTEWKYFIPNDQNIQSENPVRGFVSSANQYPADSTYPYYINGSSYEAYRNRRINNKLEQFKKATVQDMMNLQSDNYTIKAEESLPLMLGFLETKSLKPQEKAAYEILKSWDYYNNADGEGPSYFEAWWNSMVNLLWDELDNQKVELPQPSTYTTIQIMRNLPDFIFYDIQKTPEKETLADLINRSFKESVIRVEKWKKENGMKPKWAAYKKTSIEHLLMLKPFGQSVFVSGNSESINAISRRKGPSWRMIVSLEKSGVKAWGIYPGGQSGNPGSPFYDNMIPGWTNANYLELQFINNPNHSFLKPLGKLILNPL